MTAQVTLSSAASAQKSPLNAKDLSAELAAIDHQLTELLARRCDLIGQASATAQVPQATAKSLRSGDALKTAAVDAGQLDAAAVAQWLRHATSIAKAMQASQQVAFLGPEYSYSHLAAIKYFGDACPLAPVGTIAAVFDSILRGDVANGVVPIENSTDGRVVDTLGMFVRVNVKICGEVLLPIHHNLLSKSPRQAITEIHSKPQALSQCRGWLANHFPKARLVENSSTAAAAELAASSPGVAAVASIEAGRQYGLDVIAASIEDNRNNVTRFAILGREVAAATGNDKTAILFQVAHRPGALADAMLIFKETGLNLTWIESFPLPGTSSEYLFFVEAMGHQQDAPIAAALQKLAPIAIRLEVIGSYPKAS